MPAKMPSGLSDYLYVEHQNGKHARKFTKWKKKLYLYLVLTNISNVAKLHIRNKACLRNSRYGCRTFGFPLIKHGVAVVVSTAAMKSTFTVLCNLLAYEEIVPNNNN